MAGIKVCVTLQDIKNGRPGECNLCPIALALTRVTKDREVMVYNKDYIIWIEVGGHTLLAPPEVQRFVRMFDKQPRTGDGYIDIYHKNYNPPIPFEFELPDVGGPEWQEPCCHCAQAELDGEQCD
jgi:hypothetical protein